MRHPIRGPSKTIASLKQSNADHCLRPPSKNAGTEDAEEMAARPCPGLAASPAPPPAASRLLLRLRARPTTITTRSSSSSSSSSSSKERPFSGSPTGPTTRTAATTSMTSPFLCFRRRRRHRSSPGTWPSSPTATGGGRRGGASPGRRATGRGPSGRSRCCRPVSGWAGSRRVCACVRACVRVVERMGGIKARCLRVCVCGERR